MRAMPCGGWVGDLEARRPGGRETWKPYLSIDYGLFVQYIHISIDFFVNNSDKILYQNT